LLLNIKLIKIFTLFFFISYSFVTSSNSENKTIKYSYSQLGSNSAEYTLIEYASMSCVHCANFHNNELPKIKEHFIDTGIVKYIYKDFPLDKPAMFAAMVANCFEGEQYYEILSSLYRNQKTWVTEANNTGKFYGSIHEILKVHGITLETILGCVDDKSEVNKGTWNKIISTRLEGQKNGVNSTPSFFLNDKKIDEPLNYKLLEKLVK